MAENTNPDKASTERRRVKGKGLPSPEDTIGRRIREKRSECSLNVSQLAELTKGVSDDGKGLSRAVISGYEKGEYKPGTRELRILCDALEVSPNWLIYGKDATSDQADTIKRVLSTNLPELALAKLLFIISSLPENEFESVATILLSLASKDKAVKQALSDDVQVIDRMVNVSLKLEFSPQWREFSQDLWEKSDSNIKALRKKKPQDF